MRITKFNLIEEISIHFNWYGFGRFLCIFRGRLEFRVLISTLFSMVWLCGTKFAVHLFGFLILLRETEAGFYSGKYFRLFVLEFDSDFVATGKWIFLFDVMGHGTDFLFSNRFIASKST